VELLAGGATMNVLLALSVFCLELVALFVYVGRLAPHRVDRGDRPTPFRILSENARILSPSSYDRAGRRRLVWLWVGYLIVLATALYLVRSIFSSIP